MNNKFISVIIPVYNNSKGLMDTLDSIVAQDFSKKNYEVIISDNGSSDNTLDTAEMFAKKYPELIHIVVENNIKSSYAARNKGIGVSHGEILSFIDADMKVKKDWLEKINEVVESNENTPYFGYKVKMITKLNNIYSKYEKMTAFPIQNYVKEHHFVPTCCLVVKKSLFRKYGFFDDRFISSGDLEYGNRIYQREVDINYFPQIEVFHPARSSLIQLSKKNFRIGRGIQQLYKYYPNRFSGTKRNILNLRYFLPGKPWLYSKHLSNNLNWSEASLKQKTMFYFIGWLGKLFSHIGYIYEYLRNNQ